MNLKKKLVAVIGLGQLGKETFQQVQEKIPEAIGVEKDEARIEELLAHGLKNIQNTIPVSDVYIISVYLTEDVIDVCNNLDLSREPMIVIESTVRPGTCRILHECLSKKGQYDLVCFPHRYNEGDPDHNIFNLHRVIGSNSENSLERALDFYSEFMKRELVHPTSLEIAELCKPLENAYRFIEIAFAEELKLLCDAGGIDINELREAVNTKWNIDIKEPRDGIGGKCLPKDISIIDDFFHDFSFIKTAIEVDRKYKRK